MYLHYLFVIVFITGISSTDIVVVILNESHPSHITLAGDLKSNILESSSQFRKLNISVHIASQDFPNLSSWIYISLFKRLNELYNKEKNCWFIFIPETTAVNLTETMHLLSNRSKEEVFLGRALKDQDPTIIHHFDLVEPEEPFFYPDPRTGVIISKSLLERISSYLISPERTYTIDFSIDPGYELAKLAEGVNVSLTSSTLFCVKNHSMEDDHPCAIVYVPYKTCTAIDIDSIHFSIKTCKKYHTERLPVLQSTWLPFVSRFTLYSDVRDSKYGTVSSGIKNTETGHCAKTLYIIKEAAEMASLDWLVIADDDTLISVPRLLDLLGCYNPKDDIALGQKYGYTLLSYYGYDYLTGGAAMVFSSSLVRKLAEEGVCECPSLDTPDDMYLGICIRRLEVPIIHSHLFHQARPDDYPEDLLEGSAHITFHKFWLIDPIKQYNKWLNNSQLILQNKVIQHTEL